MSCISTYSRYTTFCLYIQKVDFFHLLAAFVNSAVMNIHGKVFPWKYLEKYSWKRIPVCNFKKYLFSVLWGI